MCMSALFTPAWSSLLQEPGEEKEKAEDISLPLLLTEERRRRIPNLQGRTGPRKSRPGILTGGCRSCASKGITCTESRVEKIRETKRVKGKGEIADFFCKNKGKQAVKECSGTSGPVNNTEVS